jgi:hypothetical protein
LTELKFVKKIVVDTADKIIKNAGVKLEYKVGTMIERPRAALLADEIATEAEFFSFGTNDLTQMTYGLSRDDAGRILDDYFAAKIFEADPTARLDQSGVGKLIKMAVELGKKTRPDIKLGICGEHGGDPSSIGFCHNAGLAYVSCSPFRVPIARLAAAQAAIAGVKAALSMTIPLGTSIHRRMVYIETEEGYSFEAVAAAIKQDDYFAHDETHVIQVDSVEALLDMGHGVNLVRKGVSGKTQNQLISFDMKINNPALTGQILVALARATTRQQPGAYTMIEIPVINMLYGDTEELIKRLV